MTQVQTDKTERTSDFKTPKILPPAIFLLSAIALLGLGYLETNQFGVSFWGLPFTVFALGLASWEKSRFAKVGTTIYPGQDSSTLLTDGAFKYTRNPMYLGMVVALLGLWPITGGYSPVLISLMFGVIIHFQFILKEEEQMLSLFGPEYETYMQKVRRWL